MIDIFVCVKPRPRYPGRRRSSIRDRQGCVSRGWNKEVIVESRQYIYHLTLCTRIFNFKQEQFSHTSSFSPLSSTWMKNSKKIGLFDPILCNKIYRGQKQRSIGQRTIHYPVVLEQAPVSFQVYYSTPDALFFGINLIRKWKAYKRGHL